MIKHRKIKYKTSKFFGWKEDNWARLCGKNGKKRSYGHFAGMADSCTKIEKRNADELRETKDE